jgi:predicted glycosyltransferase
MNVLFFFVHPAKFHVFKHCIDRLTAEGHHVDVAIISKDVLPDLVEKTDWNCVNIFPEGRRGETNSKIKIFSSALKNFFKTIFRLRKYISSSKIKYDLYVTDDCLSVVGKMSGVPVLFFLDNDVAMVPEYFPLFWSSTKIFAPAATNCGLFNCKKLGFRGYKELCYLHPDYFTADRSIPLKYDLTPKKYVLIRTVAFSATHDAGKEGISNSKLARLIEIVEKNGFQPVISSERSLSSEYEKYRFKGDAAEFIHILAFAAMYFGDSQTVNSEAIVLGVPAICCNDFVKIIGVMREQEERFKVTFGFEVKDFDLALDKVNELLGMPDLQQQWEAKRKYMLQQSAR